MTPETLDVDLKLDGAKEEWAESGVSNHRHILVSTDWRREEKGGGGSAMNQSRTFYFLHNSTFPIINSLALFASVSDFFSTRLHVSQVLVPLRLLVVFSAGAKKKHTLRR